MVTKVFYYVTFTSLSSDYIFQDERFENKNEALENFYLNEYDPDNQNSDVTAEIYKETVEFEEDEDYDFSDYEIDGYFDYETVKNELIKNRKYNINDFSTNLLDDFEDDLKDTFNLGYNSIKYHNISVIDDETFDELYIQVRVSNHTENLKNNDRFSDSSVVYYISVVIADYDPTFEKFKLQQQFEKKSNEFNYTYDTSTSLSTIKKEVYSQINKLAKKIENEHFK